MQLLQISRPWIHRATTQLLVAVPLFFISFGAAGAPLRSAFQCATEIPTTSFFAEIVGAELAVRVIHHNGVKYAPFHSSILTPADLEILKPRADLIQKLDDRIEVRFELKDCSDYGDGLISCYNGKDFRTSSGLQVEVVSLSLTKSTHFFQDYVFRSREVSLHLRAGEQSFAVVMKYEPKNCSL